MSCMHAQHMHINKMKLLENGLHGSMLHEVGSILQ